MYDATSGTPVSIGSLTGPLATILAYSSTPAGNIMAVGTLRFFVADTLNENVVMSELRQRLQRGHPQRDRAAHHPGP